MGGRPSQLAGRHLDVLFLDGGDHVHRRQTARRQLVRVHPDAHTVILLAEQEHVADAVDPLHLVGDVDVGVVAEVQLVVAVVGRIETDDEENIRVAFARDDADLANHVGQLGQSEIDAVLHQYLGEIQIDAGFERDAEAVGTVVGGLRGHVHHVLDAVDLLLNGSGHGLGDDARVGARIDGGNRDAGRRDLRILRDGQGPKRDAAREGDTERHHRGEDRPVDEEAREHDAWSIVRSP